MTLSGSGGEEFRGFLVQARTVADGSPVGVFTDNGDDQTLSSCTPAEVSTILRMKYCYMYMYITFLQSAITHSSNALKTSAALSWTAEGTNDIMFLYVIYFTRRSSDGFSIACRYVFVLQVCCCCPELTKYQHIL